jgi:hypothetical protein
MQILFGDSLECARVSTGIYSLLSDIAVLPLLGIVVLPPRHGPPPPCAPRNRSRGRAQVARGASATLAIS